ncbi:hypothetical protein LARV_00921 [Longilinea arvoryzae]|uniref:Uncharacterized protein n=1 Tax=Longilinea arvoryzae TaxID=360412 RepID=A0A0S7BGM6_9CHLR|nr:hypothetical protein LARV_00921 [Longilinea arvoryzae]
MKEITASEQNHNDFSGGQKYVNNAADVTLTYG